MEMTAALVRKFRQHSFRGRTLGKREELVFGVTNRETNRISQALDFYLSRMKPSKAARYYRRQFAKCPTCTAINNRAHELGLREIAYNDRFR